MFSKQLERSKRLLKIIKKIIKIQFRIKKSKYRWIGVNLSNLRRKIIQINTFYYNNLAKVAMDQFQK